MRNMSFALTTAQAREQSKTVTRRLGWKNLKPGDRVQQVVKGMGLKKGEHPEKIHVIEITSVRQEPLVKMVRDRQYGQRECRLEGFPLMSPREFVEMFCRTHKGCQRRTKVTRIEFVYIFRTTEEVDGHIWGFYKNDKFESCRLCGNIRRADKQNSPCRGKAQLTLR